MRQPIEPMRAASIGTLPLPEPGGRALVYEPKWDGWRCLAHVGERVELHSRHGRDLTRYFPDVVAQLRAHVPPGVILDGELVIYDPDRGRTSFTALQRRVTAGQAVAREAARRPAYLVVFDLLADTDGAPAFDRPLAHRRERLQQLLADRCQQLPICPQTTDVEQARGWLADWGGIGIEGLVIKDLAGRYTPGGAGWAKLKTRTTTEAIIGGVTDTRPATLLLGRLDAAGRLRYVAQTHPLAAAHRRELAPLLAPLVLDRPTAEHPWPQPLPAVWTGQFRQPQPLPYQRIQPLIVAEIQVDAAYDTEHGRWRHRAKYLRLRTELSIDELPGWHLKT